MFKRKNMLSEEERVKGIIKRQKILKDAEAMNRLSKNPDYMRFCEIMEDDKKGLNRTLLMMTGHGEGLAGNEFRIRLIARINQIDRMLKKPKDLEWQAENLTEIRDAIKDKTLERQALGK